MKSILVTVAAALVFGLMASVHIGITPTYSAENKKKASEKRGANKEKVCRGWYANYNDCIAKRTQTRAENPMVRCQQICSTTQ